MFTGIVTGLGTVLTRRADPARGVEQLTFSAPGHVTGLGLGGSIAVEGVCLSATAIEAEHITVDLIPETLQRTTLGMLDEGDPVNLERSLASGARLDGHVVQGHVDARAELIARDEATGLHRFALRHQDAPAAQFLAEKGSVAVNGVSLTLTAVGDDTRPWFEVGLIPTTLAETTLGRLNLGDEVNLEMDVLGKYARRMLDADRRSAQEESGRAEPVNTGPGHVRPGHTGPGHAEPGHTRPGQTPVLRAPADPLAVLDPVEVALNQLAGGRPVIVVDDADRENEGDLIFPAAAATEQLLAFTVRHSSGVVCVPLGAERAQHLGLPAMVAENEDPKGTAYTVSCDAAVGVSTGISAADRAHTARLLADPGTGAEDLSRPGHLFPLVADPRGVLGRAGHTEAAVDLCRLAGRAEVGVIAELVHDDGRMMRLPALREFADAHGFALISIADLITYRGGTPSPQTVSDAPRALWENPRSEAEQLVSGGPEVTLPTEFGTFTAQVWTEQATAHEHLLLSAPGASGGAAEGPQAPGPLVRLHSECLTGDVFGSHRCDCGTQLISALQRLHRDGGHLLYLRGHEGRGIGLANKLRAYRLQQEGADTVEANEMLGLAAELRDYTGAAAVLHARGITRLRLLTNNPEKVEALRETGLQVTQVPSDGVVHAANRRYLRTKRDRMRHMMDHRQDIDENPTDEKPTDENPHRRGIRHRRPGRAAMSSTGTPTIAEQELRRLRQSAPQLRVAVIAGRWHEQVRSGLLAGVRRFLAQVGIRDFTLVEAPGSFELPVLARHAAVAHDVVIALGVVIRGGTPHFEYVCRAATDGLTQVAVATGVPIGFGLLTCDDEQQAVDRAGLEGSREDKGFEAAHAAVVSAVEIAALR
ncbi:3,4-dihydroxy-2-butanone-4-phosphate synthase [Nesterenkonia aerolata]|uniref:Multifunctional fusion protein n=1 Tax=Nesterenkonia aerolata TaxID=3074079 RepID=A0ABU2DPQ6_9MICC|nr:3,4-dihydroxy-2-butanone-4-phosphate synthase [Nesterenkonia sp. LY-0111]MDR8018498.1 3,4-dihydroxy-2-butanone-4-phosphate synthase [Nesterenkonia sp. LY-0111]